MTKSDNHIQMKVKSGRFTRGGMDTKVRKWIRWLDVINEEIQQLLIARDIFWSVQNLIRNNKNIQKSSAFYQYLGDTYISHVIIGIRRQLKINEQSISFLRMLKEMEEDPKRLSRKSYKDLYVGSAVEELADYNFDKFCSTPDEKHVSPTLIKNDVEELKQLANTCEDFSDKRVAHRDKRDPRILPKFHEIDDVIEKLDELCVKYNFLLNASSMDTLMPTYQYDWQEIFDFQWRVNE